MKIDMFTFLKRFIPLAVALTAVIGFAYVAVQQNYRMSANDPQIQLAEDGAMALATGTDPKAIVGDKTIDAGISLAPFTTVFDANRNVLATSGQFDGQTLAPPTGSFDSAKAHIQDRFTWAPRPGSRDAAVLVYIGGNHPGYVLAARSLYEVEAREDNLTKMAAAALAVALAALVAFTLINRKS